MTTYRFTTWLQGGATLSDPPVCFTPEEIYGPAPLIFYAFEMPLPRTWKQFENYLTVKDYQEEKNLAQRIRPTFG